MRQNLGGLWRAPKVQQDKKTKRTDKEIVAEVLRGYEVATYSSATPLGKVSRDWRLQMIRGLPADGRKQLPQRAEEDRETSRRNGWPPSRSSPERRNSTPPLCRPWNSRTRAQTFSLTWFYAALGASDLEGVKPEHILAQKQIPLIRAAIEALPGEAAARHATLFANALATRMTAAAPAVKHTYLSAGMRSPATTSAPGPRRELLAYYKDLITEIQLQV